MSTGHPLPVHAAASRLERPEWLKVRANTTGEYEEVRAMMRRLSLVTVCEEARCPNIHECWARERTATFMLLGDICTRHCGFCAVGKGKPGAIDPDEPARVAEAARELGLAHAVVTSVNRDDLADGGASQFAATIRAIRQRNPGCTVEVLVPDFCGNWDALDAVLDEAPEILNHNTETVPRLYRRVRPDARYAQSLELLARAHERRSREGLPLRTKSGLMVGLGETFEELVADARGSPGRRLRHRDARPVPPAARASAAGRALLHARGVRASARGRRGAGLRARGIRTPRAIVVSRPPGLRRSRRVRGGRRARFPAAALLLALAAGLARARGRTAGRCGRTISRPSIPENLAKTQRQGNVNFIGRIDTQGRVTELRVLATNHPDFVAPAADAVKAWQFRPATRNGKPVEISANIAVRFRMEGDTRGVIPGPILGDLAISPADAAGKATAPEGFPIRRGADKALQAIALLDVPPNVQARTIAVTVEAVSPSGKHVPRLPAAGRGPRQCDGGEDSGRRARSRRLGGGSLAVAIQGRRRVRGRRAVLAGQRPGAFSIRGAGAQAVRPACAAALLGAAALVAGGCQSSAPASPQARPCLGLTPPRVLAITPLELPATFAAARLSAELPAEVVIGPDGSVRQAAMRTTAIAVLAPFAEETLEARPLRRRVVRGESDVRPRAGAHRDRRASPFGAASDSRGLGVRRGGRVPGSPLAASRQRVARDRGRARSPARGARRRSSPSLPTARRRVSSRSRPRSPRRRSTRPWRPESSSRAPASIRLELRGADVLSTARFTIADDSKNAVISACETVSVARKTGPGN